MADVRFGLRMAFSRASVPAIPLRRGERRTEHPAERTGEDRTEDGHAEEDQHGARGRPAAMPAPPNRPAPMATAPERGDAEPDDEPARGCWPT